MQLVVIDVTLEDELLTPEPKLDPGEHIVTKVVEIDKLQATMDGKFPPPLIVYITALMHVATDYDKKVFSNGKFRSTDADIDIRAS